MLRLKMRHRNGANAAEVVVSRCVLIDHIIQIIWRQAQHEPYSGQSRTPGILPQVTWIALGEYGRLELAPFSPVDLLALMKPQPKNEIGPELETILNLLHSFGSEVRISVLTPKECLHRAQNFFPFAFSLLSGRYVTGGEPSFHELRQKFHTHSVKNQLAFTYELLSFLDEHHQKYGDSPYLLESNIKFGAGGLLDYAAVLASIKLRIGSERAEEILRKGELTPAQWQRLETARLHLLQVRNHLHFTSDRREDVLSHDRLKAFSNPARKSVSIFLKETLRQRRTIDASVRSYLHQTRARLSQRAEEIKDQYLKLTSSPLTLKAERSPERWMKLFHFSQAQPQLLTDPLQAVLPRDPIQWDIRSFDSPPIHAEFRLILRNKGKVGSTLRRMRDLGFLGKYLPEFGRLECLPPEDPLRRYSLDEHTLRALEALDGVVNSCIPSMHDYQRIIDQVVDPSLIYVALLLHESGSGFGAESLSMSERLAGSALQRLGFDPESREKAQLLIREHQSLGHVSQRRDLDDPLILQEVSGSIETADNLNMLLLLTYADFQSMGPEAWNERKDFLLWSLYFKICDYLMFGDEISEPEHAQVAAAQQKVLEQLEGELSVDVILKHFMFLPEKYSLYTPLPLILTHVRLCERLQEHAVVTLWTPHPHAGYTELVLSTRDVPGRFAQIAGTLTAQGLSILSAQLNTREDGIVIDTFQVCDVEGNAVVDSQYWNKVDRLLADIIGGEKNLEEVLASRFKEDPKWQATSGVSPRVRIDNEIASQSTVIEVQAEDRLGLGYRIAKTLADLGLNILSAKLATEKTHAFDVFYVQNRDGEKITGSFQMTEILERLRFQLN